jgi:hypothetical protein
MITLGKKFKDRVTGFEGVATGFCTYITGCSQVLLAPEISADGSLRDSPWFDQQRLEEQPGDAVVLDNGATPGFDREAPKR